MTGILNTKYKNQSNTVNRYTNIIFLSMISFISLCIIIFIHSDFGIKWDERYLILKETFLMLVRPSDGIISYVMLFDQNFTARIGRRETGVKYGLLLEVTMFSIKNMYPYRWIAPQMYLSSWRTRSAIET